MHRVPHRIHRTPRVFCKTLSSICVFSQTSEDTFVDIQHDFELSGDRLKNKEMYFHNEVNQHREEMGMFFPLQLAHAW